MSFISTDTPLAFLAKTLLILVAVVGWNCSSNERVDTSSALKAEIKSKQIRRITTGDINEALQKAGEKIVTGANLAVGQDTAALANCTSQAFREKFAPLKKRIQAEVSLVVANDTLRSDLSEKERELLKAYHYQSTTQPGSLTHHLQKIDLNTSVYYAPLPADSPILTHCDEARRSSFVLWRISLNQKEIIQHLQ